MLSNFHKNKKRKFSKEIFLKVSTGILLLAAIFFLINANLKIRKRRTDLQEKIEDLKRETEVLEKRNAELSEQIAKAGDKESLERISREQLGLKKPGEEVVVISKEDKEEENEPNEEEKSFWNPQEWWEWFKSQF